MEIDPNVGGHAYREVVGWCLRNIEEEREAGRLEALAALQIRELVLRLRASMGTIYDFSAQPIPYFYVRSSRTISSPHTGWLTLRLCNHRLVLRTDL
jgi:hypothetical protein